MNKHAVAKAQLARCARAQNEGEAGAASERDEVTTNLGRARVGAPPQLNPVLELDGTGAVLYRYVYATMGHSPDYVVNGAGATYRVVRDQLGSPLLIVNITNPSDVLLDARYSAFGTRTATTVAASAPTLGYAGGIYDEDTGLVRFGARDYDAMVGRWTAKDPSLFDGQDSNLYAYGFTDPVNYNDPEGELANLVLGAGAGAGLDLAWQLWDNGGELGCVDWTQVAVAGAAGAAGVGIFSKIRVATGPMKQWIRLGSSYSRAGQRPVAMSIRGGIAKSRGTLRKSDWKSNPT